MIEKNNKRKWMRIRESTVSLDPRRKKTTSLRITRGVSRELDQRGQDNVRKTEIDKQQRKNKKKKLSLLV